MKLIPIALVITALASATTLAQTLETVPNVTGHVHPVKETDLKPEKSGRIKKLHVSQGDHVKAGDLLVEIDEEETLATKELRAPSAGIVVRTPVIQGQSVRPPSADDSGTVLMTIADYSKVVVEAHVKQTDATKLALKQAVQIMADGVPDAKMEGVRGCY